MPLARIRTVDPDSAADLAAELSEAGFEFEFVSPEDQSSENADIEVLTERLPTQQAFDRAYEMNTAGAPIFVAPGLLEPPESAPTEPREPSQAQSPKSPSNGTGSTHKSDESAATQPFELPESIPYSQSMDLSFQNAPSRFDSERPTEKRSFFSEGLGSVRDVITGTVHRFRERQLERAARRSEESAARAEQAAAQRQKQLDELAAQRELERRRREELQAEMERERVERERREEELKRQHERAAVLQRERDAYEQQQREAEEARQRQLQLQLEQERARELEAQQKRERELAAQRERELAAQRERELALQREREAKQREIELTQQRERELAQQRERELAEQRERELALKRERELQAHLDAQEKTRMYQAFLAEKEAKSQQIHAQAPAEINTEAHTDSPIAPTTPVNIESSTAPISAVEPAAEVVHEAEGAQPSEPIPMAERASNEEVALFSNGAIPAEHVETAQPELPEVDWHRDEPRPSIFSKANFSKHVVAKFYPMSRQQAFRYGGIAAAVLVVFAMVLWGAIAGRRPADPLNLGGRSAPDVQQNVPFGAATASTRPAQAAAVAPRSNIVAPSKPTKVQPATTRAASHKPTPKRARKQASTRHRNRNRNSTAQKNVVTRNGVRQYSDLR